MLSNYRSLYQTKGSLKISFAGLIARLPIAMDGLAILYVTLAAGKSYSLAGALAGVAALTTVISSPIWAKIADQRGQGFVLRWAVLLRISALFVFALVATANMPIWIWFLTIIIAESASFSMGSFTRRRWTFILESRAKDQISTAYAVESILDEIVFILGPLVATTVATQINPLSAIFAGIIFLAIGSQALAWDRATEPILSKDSSKTKHKSILKNRHLQSVAIPLTIAGGYFSAITLVVVAYTKESGVAATSGILLSLWAVGGASSVFVSGALRWTISHGTRFILYTLGLGILSAALPFISDIKVLGLMLFLHGTCIGPLLPNAIPVAEKSVPSEQMTQGISLITAGIPLVGAISSFMTGQVIDLYGVKISFWMPFFFMVLSVLSMFPYLRYYND